jgi:isopenicillin N synthase-like dioxygenase
MDPALATELAVPVIDLQASASAEERRREVVQQIGQACIEWGGFQVINHGVSSALMDRIRRVAAEFFALPVEEKWKYSATTPTTTVDLFHGYGTKDFGTKGALDLGDQLRHRTWPLSLRAYEQWPMHPESFRETEEEYMVEMDKLNKHLLELISESLGLSPSYLSDFVGEDYQQTFLVNHYLPSPDPTTPTDGLQKHSDICALTILMQSLPGLQLKKDGQWYSVDPIPGAYAVNLGDQIEILTNGLYTSPEHRALLNAKERFSIGAFCGPADDKVVGPIPEMVSELKPARYRTRTYAAYRREVMTIPHMAKTLEADA